MAEIYLRKTLAGFAPADADSEDRHRAYKLGEVYRATIVKPRNYKHHCLFLVLLELTYNNQDRYSDFRMFRRAIALEAGHVEQIITIHGEPQLIPLSYSYDEIPDEDDFTAEFGKAMGVCAAILRITRPQLEDEVSKYATERYGFDDSWRQFTERAA